MEEGDLLVLQVKDLCFKSQVTPFRASVDKSNLCAVCLTQIIIAGMRDTYLSLKKENSIFLTLKKENSILNEMPGLDFESARLATVVVDRIVL